MPPSVLHKADRFVNPARAAWRMLCLGRLIAQGVYTVRRRFPAMDHRGRDAEVQRWSCCVLRVLQVDVASTGSLGPATRMLVANHVSWLDVMVFHSLYPHARFVAKAEVQSWPAIGSLAAHSGSLFVDRQSPRQARQVVDQISRAMGEGGLVAVFAEGTTSAGDSVLPFRAGLLQAATTTGCMVQPVALRYSEGDMALSRSVPYIGDDGLLSSLWRLCSARGVAATLKFLPPHDASQTDRRTLALALHADICTALSA
jgi:1-acyl-sn-glycerol-3-phosphate acyltransferase